MSDGRLYLIHIAESIEKIEDYTRDGRDGFMNSPMAQDAVVRNIEIIGGACETGGPGRLFPAPAQEIPYP